MADLGKYLDPEVVRAMLKTNATAQSYATLVHKLDAVLPLTTAELRRQATEAGQQHPRFAEFLVAGDLCGLMKGPYDKLWDLARDFLRLNGDIEDPAIAGQLALAYAAERCGFRVIKLWEVETNGR